MERNSPNSSYLSQELQNLIAKASLIDVSNTDEYKSIMEEISAAISNISISNPIAFEAIKNSEEFKFFEYAMNETVKEDEIFESINDQTIDFFVPEEIVKKADELEIEKTYRKEFFEIETTIEEDEKKLEKLWQKQKELSKAVEEVFKEIHNTSEFLEFFRARRTEFLSSHSKKIKMEHFNPNNHPDIELELKKAIRFFLGDSHESCANSFIFYCKKGFLDKNSLDMTPNFGRQLQETFVQTFYCEKLFKQYSKNETFLSELENFIRYKFKEFSFSS